MADIRVPSLQHLARNWMPKPQQVERRLVKLAVDPPRFNYNPLFGAVHDLLILKVPYDDVERGIKRIKRLGLRENLLSVLPLIRDHFEDVHPDFYQAVDRRYYPAGRGLMVPFDPPLIYGVDGQLYFPWFSFWRSNPLAAERLSLFVTLVDEVLLQDPDLERARFEILDFSAPTRSKPRELTVTPAADIPKIGDRRKAEMLEVFAEGYFRAVATLAGRPRTKDAEPSDRADPNQPEFPDFPG